MSSFRVLDFMWRVLSASGYRSVRPIRVKAAVSRSSDLGRIAARRFAHRPPLRQWWPETGHERDAQLRNAKPIVTGDTLRRVTWSPKTHVVVIVSVGAAVGFYFANLQTVPVSGRKRFNCYSEEAVEAMCAGQVNLILQEIQSSGARILGPYDWRTQMVNRVMNKLIPFSGMEDAKWEVRVIDDPRHANAFVLPGGKVFVYSGIIPIAGNEEGLAAVLGHEIAHNVAQHVGERMSGQIGINILLGSMFLLLAAIDGGFFVTYVGSKLMNYLFALPMNRKQESEADYIGLMMMAQACYNPRAAVRFWERMESRLGANSPPEWMSTHPSNYNRIEKIQSWLPQATDLYTQSDCHNTSAFAKQFRRALDMGTMMDRRTSF